MSDFSLCFDSVVAIHGLGAHPDDTWYKNVGTKEESKWVNWLEAPFMLPNDIPNARIMRYGYMSQWFGKNAIKQSTSDVAKDFLINLRRWRKDTHRPLIIIAHCFGGLVVLKALNDARNHESEYPTIFNYTTGLVFLGTPFRGASGMSQSGLLQAVVQEYEEVQAQTLRILDPGNDPLHDLVTEFCLIRSTPPRAHVACFYEQIASDVMVIVGKSGTKNFVVNRESACLDQSESTKTYPIARNHFDMNKFGKPTNEYYKVAEAIQGMVQEAQDLIHERADSNDYLLLEDASTDNGICFRTRCVSHLMLTRHVVDERLTVAAVKRLIDVTDGPSEEQCQEHAERVQEDMSILIESAFQKANFIKSTAMNKVHGPQSSSHRDADLRRILAIVRVDTTVKINRRIQHRSIISNATRLVAQTYKDTISIASGKFNIRTTKCKTENDQDASFVSVVTFTADESQYKQFILSMYFFQRYGNDGSNVLPPCIIAHAVIPDDSLTIQVVRSGNLTELKQLLATGQARVWDCDSVGRSLLSIAVSCMKPIMVKYLIAQGLDPNSVGLVGGWPGRKLFVIS
ncbi:hypothetical protein D6D00_05831 [Aureobasidium pullulans]|nr:hypothetical protein D6D00_05831 [Aureobasidium pullulans]